jgi:hypothetical protein
MDSRNASHPVATGPRPLVKSATGPTPAADAKAPRFSAKLALQRAFVAAPTD